MSTAADLEIWWASLPVKEKERIALKGLQKAGVKDPSKSYYPACSAWWVSLPHERREAIKAHCEAAHGDIVREWDDANPYGD